MISLYLIISLIWMLIMFIYFRHTEQLGSNKEFLNIFASVCFSTLFGFAWPLTLPIGLLSWIIWMVDCE